MRGGGGGCSRGCGMHGVADRVAGEYEFHAAVLGATFRGIVGRYWLSLAESVGFYSSGGNSLLHEIIANDSGTLLGEILVVFVAADAVGVSFDGEVQAGIGEHDAANFGQALAGGGQKLEAAAAEQDIGHVGD